MSAAALSRFHLPDVEEVEVDDERTRKEYAPSRQEKIRAFTIFCLIMNRSIGSGIFATPAKVVRGTNSVGISIIYWAIGGFLALCGTLVWLEFGMSIPREHVEGKERAVPRSGGEKNYLEWILQKPKFLATCMYGIAFIIVGNLSGNAIAFGRYCMKAANGPDEPERGPVIGIAIATLFLITLLHVFSRRGGIILNNTFAVVKVLILLTIIVVGFTVRAGKNFNKGKDHERPIGASFAPNSAFADKAEAFASYTSTFLYVLFTYSGFEQPFHVLSEVDRPRKTFARSVIPAIIVLTTLFVLVNIAYLCVVPLDVINDPLNAKIDIATLFFDRVFGTAVATRVMQGFICISILGNLIVMTFTAARVKQEIAKEGILPFSLVFASGKTTPTAKLLARISKKRSKVETEMIDGHEHLEQSPMAALGLHFFMSVFLVAVTAKLNPSDAYDFLTSLYAYVIICVFGFFTSLGLLYSKFIRKDFVSQIPILGGPAAAILYLLSMSFFLITSFFQAPGTHPTVPNFVVPTVGLSSILWGVVWWLGLKLVMRQRGQRLVVTRTAFCDKVDDKGEWVLKYEIIDHVWKADSEAGSLRSAMTDPGGRMVADI